MRHKYKDFNEQVKAILKARKDTSVDETKLAATAWKSDTKDLDAKFEDKRLELFVLTFRDTHSKDIASRTSRLRPSEVVNMMNPAHKQYNAEFTALVQEEEQRRAWVIEDDAWKQAAVGDAPMQRFLLERTVSQYGQRAKSAVDANAEQFNANTLRSAMEGLREILVKIRRESGGKESTEQVFKAPIAEEEEAPKYATN
jgi:hypothetical protein